MLEVFWGVCSHDIILCLANQVEQCHGDQSTAERSYSVDDKGAKREVSCVDEMAHHDSGGHSWVQRAARDRSNCKSSSHHCETDCQTKVPVVSILRCSRHTQ